ncbi:FxsA family protein [Pseudonocardia phyllosphaerae]|uniref:FxsA family protein n=1 Tax=Pseudonocardia phyllosphaerae TaxID=3390502 RepID=UPI00397BE29F
MPFLLLYVVLEVLAVVALASWIGLGWTLLVLLAGSLLGLALARREGIRAARALATAVQRGKLAHSEATDGLLVALGGVLLFVPGLITDVLGLLLLVPPIRGIVRRRLVGAAERRSPGLRTARIRYGATVVDGEVVPDEPAGRGPAPAVGRGPVVEGEIVEGEVVDGPRRES